jgi:hypothetical protein
VRGKVGVKKYLNTNIVFNKTKIMSTKRSKDNFKLPWALLT